MVYRFKGDLELKKHIIISLVIISIFSVALVESFEASITIDVIDPPSLISADALDDTTILLTFKEPSDTSLIIQYNIYRSTNGISFTFLNSVPVGSTDYTDVALSSGTYTYFMASQSKNNESPPSQFLSATVGGSTPSLAEPPNIVAIKSDGISQLYIIWEEPKDTSVVQSYSIERMSNIDPIFSRVGSEIVGSTIFNDQNLFINTKYTYRIFSIDTNGVPSKQSNEYTAVVSVDQTTLVSIGTVLEPTSENKFNPYEISLICQTVEMFNVDPAIIQQMYNDVATNKLNAYEVIKKMIDGSYGSSQELKSAGAFYGQFYIDTNDLSKYLQEIQQKAVSVTGGSDGKGNNPFHAVPIVGR